MKWIAKLKALARRGTDQLEGPGENVLPQAPEMPPSDAVRLKSLTRREREVFALLAQGKKMREAAESLGVKQTTISFHTTALYKKLGVRSRTEMILRYGLAGIPKGASGEKGGDSY